VIFFRQFFEMDGQRLSATHVVTILRKLHICPDATEAEAQQWLSDMDEQIAEFLEHRRVEDEEEPSDEETGGEAPVQPLKFFESVSQLLWWTLCCATSFDFRDLEPKEIAAQAAVPGQANFDDYLCLLTQEYYGEDEECAALCNALYVVLNAALLDCTTQLIGSDEDAEAIESARENVLSYFAASIRSSCPDAETMATQLELGCNLYATMIATVDSKQDDFALRRWRECYSTKCREILTWLGRRHDDDNIIWTRSNMEPEYALLVVFTKRADLFRAERQLVKTQLHARMVKDKNLFDIENDHSSIESEFKCPKCGSFKTKQFLIQVRSADEPMTQFWKCWNCNKSGREN